MRVLLVVMGILMTVAGIFCLANIENAWESFAFILGIVMIVNGLSQILSYVFSKKASAHTGWLLGEGLFTFILGFIVLLYPFQSDILISIVFGLWLLISGSFRIVAGIEMPMSNNSRALVILTGFFSICVGILGFLHPYIWSMALAAILGVFFIMQGINSLTTGAALPGKRR